MHVILLILLVATSYDVVSVVCMVVVDEKERKNGNDPEKELVDSGFHDYRRPLVAFVSCVLCAEC